VGCCRAGNRKSLYSIAFVEIDMCGAAVLFFLLAIVAAIFGFTGIAQTLSWLAWIFLIIFVVLFILSLIVHLIRGGRTPFP
jgi:uncharacterized membrane protein YtjA (UPF0391 family)